MIEPSPEAKQAAEECCQGLLGEDEVAHIIQQAIDTATAKLREELLHMTQSRDHVLLWKLRRSKR